MKITDLRSISAKGERRAGGGCRVLSRGRVLWAWHCGGAVRGGPGQSPFPRAQHPPVGSHSTVGTWPCPSSSAPGRSRAGGAGLGGASGGCWFGGCRWWVLVWGCHRCPAPLTPPPSHRRRAGDHAKDGDPGVDAAAHPGDAGELRGHGHTGGAAGQPPRRQPRPPPGQLQPQPLAQLQPQQPGHALAVTRARRAPGQSPARRHGTVGGPRASALAAAPRHGGRTPHSPGTPSLPERTPGGAPQPPAPPPAPGKARWLSHISGAWGPSAASPETPRPHQHQHPRDRDHRATPLLAPSWPSGGEAPAGPRTPRKQSHLKEKRKQSIYI